MSLLSTTPHGADSARSLPQSGKNSVSNMPARRTSSLPNSTPPLTKLMVFKLADTQLSSSIQRITRLVSPMRATETSKVSPNILPRTPPSSRKLETLPRPSSEERKQTLLKILSH